MQLEKLTREKMEEAIPTDEIKTAFLRRPDIEPLPAKEQEARWAEHQESLNRFLDFLADQQGVII